MILSMILLLVSLFDDEEVDFMMDPLRGGFRGRGLLGSMRRRRILRLCRGVNHGTGDQGHH
jgi:hypothetical protein